MILNSQDYFIRSAKAEDLQSLANLEAQTVPCPWSLAHYETALSSGNALWLLLQKDILLGAVIARAVADEAEILNCFIAQPWQGKGAATYLLSWVLSKLAQAGVKHCFLEVRATNAAAQALYRRLNFSAVGQRRHYYPPQDPAANSTREDAIVMACDI